LLLIRGKPVGFDFSTPHLLVAFSWPCINRKTSDIIPFTS
jgi:hypothetical protein